jgi:hypothetical protein
MILTSLGVLLFFAIVWIDVGWESTIVEHSPWHCCNAFHVVSKRKDIRKEARPTCGRASKDIV